MSLADLPGILAAFVAARRALAIPDRAALLARQDRALAHLRRTTLPASPFYAPLAEAPFQDWPILNKASWMENFDRINTRGIRHDAALALAEQAERARDFAPTIGDVTVGLSTGTSGRRGLFLASPAERRLWAGVMMAALLTGNPLRPRKVAFLLRANSNLYATAGIGPVRFRFFDLLQPWLVLLAALRAYAPDVLIAPASVLALLAEAGGLTPREVISVAETLHDDEAAQITAAFGTAPRQVYQATEGVIGLPCRHGRLHLNEAYLRIETDWIDRATHRFAPVVTDLFRRTQPVLRYRLDDIVTLDPTPCPCGAAARVIARIEGRADDICTLLTGDGDSLPVFPDLLTRAVLAACPDMTRFQLVQHRPGQFALSLPDAPDPAQLERLTPALATLAGRLGARAPVLEAGPPLAPAVKRRRVVRVHRQHGGAKGAITTGEG
ncbi:MAG: adenylate synthase [Rubellimicrobium sp.]|nr:adenylate synthase [Rubellimicrobium sp.]